MVRSKFKISFLYMSSFVVKLLNQKNLMQEILKDM